MNKTIDILLSFNDASRIQAEQFSQILMEAFERGNVTDAQVDSVSALLEKHRQWCAENEGHIKAMRYEQ